MSPLLGVHTGLQNTTVAELQRPLAPHRGPRLRLDLDLGPLLLRRLQRATTATRPSPPTPRSPATPSGSGCGSLVYCAGYRHPAVLANAIATIDHLSGGRADLGLGAGWAAGEYDAYGIPFPSAGERLDLLEESIQCVRGLLRQERHRLRRRARSRSPTPAASPSRCRPSCRSGSAAAARSGRCASPPATPTGGTCRSSRPRVRPQARRAGRALRRRRPRPRRDPHGGQRRARRGRRRACGRSSAGMAEYVRPGVLVGSPDEMVDRIGEYVDAGADQINIALRAPWDLGVLDRLAAAKDQSAPLMPDDRRVDPLTGARVRVVAGPPGPAQPAPTEQLPVLRRRPRGSGALRGEGVPQPVAADARRAVPRSSSTRPTTTPPSARSADRGPRGSSTSGPSAPRRSGPAPDVAYVLVFENRGAGGGRDHPPPARPDLRLRRDPAGPARELAGDGLLALRRADRRPRSSARPAGGG